MTTVQVLRRMETNMRLFPTLTSVMAVLAIAAFAEMILLVSAVSRSIMLGVIASTAISLVELGAAVAIFQLISNDPELFSSLERRADLLYQFMYMRTASAAAPADEDENGFEGEESDYEAEEEDEGSDYEVPDSEQDSPQSSGIPGEEQR